MEMIVKSIAEEIKVVEFHSTIQSSFVVAIPLTWKWFHC